MAYDAVYFDDLGYPEDYRTPFIDNLRTTLTILLIIQHSISELAYASEPYLHSIPLTVFVTISRTVLVGLFFFVSGYCSTVSRGLLLRRDADFLWKRTLRLLVPGFLYGIGGYLLLYMVLTKTWPSFFDALDLTYQHVPDQAIPLISHAPALFTKLEGPVAHVLFLYALDVAYVVFVAKKKAVLLVSSTLPKAKRDSEGHSERWLRIGVKSKQDWYRLVTVATALLALSTFVIVATGRNAKPLAALGFNFSLCPTIHPSAPLQLILAYAAGTQLYKWQRFMILPPTFTFPAFVASLSLSSVSLVIALRHSPILRDVLDFNDPSPISFAATHAGYTLPALFYSVWSSFTFVTLAISSVSLFTQLECTTRDWGCVSRHTYVPVWVHMVPVVVFAKLLTADEGVTAMGVPCLEGSLVWKVLLVSTGSVLCSWFFGLGVAWVVWMMGF